MAGILSYGAYIPFYRLQRVAIGAALETKADKGERAVASFDEDTVTMAVEARMARLRWTPFSMVSVGMRMRTIAMRSFAAGAGRFFSAATC